MSAKFGWCSDGAHDKCPVTIRPFYVDDKTKRVVLHPHSRACGCDCHAS